MDKYLNLNFIRAIILAIHRKKSEEEKVKCQHNIFHKELYNTVNLIYPCTFEELSAMVYHLNDLNYFDNFSKSGKLNFNLNGLNPNISKIIPTILDDTQWEQLDDEKRYSILLNDL